MVTFRVRASSLTEVASLLGAVVTTFDANLSAVDSHVKRTVGTTWQGEDAESFNEGWAMFMATSAAVRHSLASLQAGLIAADGSYTQTESGVQRSFIGNVGMVRNVAGASRTVSARVDTGEERAELIEDFFGRGDDGGSTGAVVSGGMVRATSGQSTGSAPADEADEDAIDAEPPVLGARPVVAEPPVLGARPVVAVDHIKAMDATALAGGEA